MGNTFCIAIWYLLSKRPCQLKRLGHTGTVLAFRLYFLLFCRSCDASRSVRRRRSGSSVLIQKETLRRSHKYASWHLVQSPLILLSWWVLPVCCNIPPYCHTLCFISNLHCSSTLLSHQKGCSQDTRRALTTFTVNMCTVGGFNRTTVVLLNACAVEQQLQSLYHIYPLEKSHMTLTRE